MIKAIFLNDEINKFEDRMNALFKLLFSFEEPNNSCPYSASARNVCEKKTFADCIDIVNGHS